MIINVPVWSFNELEAMIPREIQFPYCVKKDEIDYITYTMISLKEIISIDVWTDGMIDITIDQHDLKRVDDGTISIETFMGTKLEIYGFLCTDIQILDKSQFLEVYKNALVILMNTLKDIDPNFEP